ncbi:hypothetical protein [Ramlibacter sp. 2FC]|uniref:hypothetical protein n=1 Tax=Ramlibacter sp. 2FC TaxID=2502188 RepID=UPI0010F91F02|nr:hypothetical protein [Ramlibacter sp. 2FC]
MTESLTQTLGPPPFRFTPNRDPLEGPAFSRPFKVLVTLLVWGCAAWLLDLWRHGRLGPGIGGMTAWFLAGQALLLLTWWHILRSRTRLDSEGLHQSWVWDKHLPSRELAYGKLIRVRGLDWLIAPRLYLRTLLGKFAVFYVADPALLAESERLLRELKAFRGF